MRDLQEDLEKIRKTNGYHAEMWPYMLCEHAIERAIKAEAEVERLRKKLEITQDCEDMLIAKKDILQAELAKLTASCESMMASGAQYQKENARLRNREEYQPYEFCRMIACDAFYSLNIINGQAICRECKAYQFHDYLQSEDYEISRLTEPQP